MQAIDFEKEKAYEKEREKLIDVYTKMTEQKFYAQE